ncbi:MAG: hypothetical protein LM600_02175 [Thaumarchaeota archaeon]|jgi:hypothetical protein|nr:hypothetical protein [Nitrososphaerota archaeon]MCL7393303.1 hypothetical protein [Candidatus Wolframiiraptor allenii]
MGAAAKIWAALCFVLSGIGVAFIITGILMYIFRVGRNPLLAILIGIGFNVLSYLTARKLPRCPRCGSTIIIDGKCGVCDYKLNKDH